LIKFVLRSARERHELFNCDFGEHWIVSKRVFLLGRW
jgi:hypothetical protein